MCCDAADLCEMIYEKSFSGTLYATFFILIVLSHTVETTFSLLITGCTLVASATSFDEWVSITVYCILLNWHYRPTCLVSMAFIFFN